MFIGHFAVAFAAKKVAPRTSVATLIAAAQLLDLIWPVLVLLGVETVRIDPAAPSPFLKLRFVHYPWTHSLLMAIVWGVGFALVYRSRTGYARGAALVGALVVSHWVLDWITHRPDLQLAPGADPRVGLGLWTSPAATVALEGALFVAGVAVYARTTRPRDRAGTWGLWGFVAFLLVAYASTLAAGEPPSSQVVAESALIGWALIPWIAWFDRHREPTLPERWRP
ncbi:MAG: metal-dependent hydrolase [Myxococcales bacterium]